MEAKAQGGGYLSWFWGSSKTAAADTASSSAAELKQLDQALTQDEKQRLYEAIGYQVQLNSSWTRPSHRMRNRGSTRPLATGYSSWS